MEAFLESQSSVEFVYNKIEHSYQCAYVIQCDWRRYFFIMFFAPETEFLKVHWIIMERMAKVKCHKDTEKCSCNLKKPIPINNCVFESFFPFNICKKSVSHHLFKLGCEITHLHNEFKKTVIGKRKKMLALSMVAEKMENPNINFNTLGPYFFIDKDFKAFLRCEK